MKLLEIQTQDLHLIPQVERPIEIRREIPRRENAIPSYETIHKMIANCRAFERSHQENLGNYVDIYA